MYMRRGEEGGIRKVGRREGGKAGIGEGEKRGKDERREEWKEIRGKERNEGWKEGGTEGRKGEGRVSTLRKAGKWEGGKR
jgi:hypothetical protein